MKEMKCDVCIFFAKPAVGYLEIVWAATRRVSVCQKHKEEMLAKNERERFSNPTFAPKVTFFPNSPKET